MYHQFQDVSQSPYDLFLSFFQFYLFLFTNFLILSLIVLNMNQDFLRTSQTLSISLLYIYIYIGLQLLRIRNLISRLSNKFFIFFLAESKKSSCGFRDHLVDSKDILLKQTYSFSCGFLHVSMIFQDLFVLDPNNDGPNSLDTAVSNVY